MGVGYDSVRLFLFTRSEGLRPFQPFGEKFLFFNLILKNLHLNKVLDYDIGLVEMQQHTVLLDLND